jgi:BlaI family transcriptional regulator, penicillinase repressor
LQIQKIPTTFVVEIITIMKQLTKAEEQVMLFLWKLNEAVVKDIVEQFDEPRPAYTTVATVLKVLEKKGFVTHRSVGNTHVFHPLVSKKDYSAYQFKSLLEDYFHGSFPKLATFFIRENNLSISELEELLKTAERELKNNNEQHLSQ